ncbi:MAG: hypothetical protein E7463_04820 [Ruminococcaceae bacterium]|nr:hypothetical protein [Oscillospiraceae bacterium]
MRLIDANACIGADFVRHPIVNHESFIVMDQVQTADTPAQLIPVMDRFGIEKAAVWHRAQYDYDPVKGNAILADAMKGYEDRLYPAWTILPAITDRDFEPDVFLANMKAAGVKLLRAFPMQNRYILCDVTMGEQLSLFEELKIPLYLEPQPGYEYIYDVLREFPRLTVILSNIGIWPSARLIWPLLNRYPNVYFESGDFGMTHGYEEVCAKFGSERLLFGSNFPSNYPSCSINCLMTAGITEHERENIAHGNFERLLREVKL